MNNNVRIVPIQHLCMLCGDELPVCKPMQSLAARMCRACLRLLSEHMLFRELEQRQKIVRV